jgi:translation initiation factor IF-3
MPTYQARRLAEEAGLDLVEVAPHERPPVCRIMDYGKYKYEQSIKEKGRKQKSKDAEIKELRLRPKIGDNDILVKVNSARKFLEQGKKVQFNLIYKNRELAHKDEGFKVVDKVIEQLKDVGKIEIKPTLQGTKLFCRFEPTKE